MYNQDPYWFIPTICLASDRIFHAQMRDHLGKKSSAERRKEKNGHMLVHAAQDYQFYFGGRVRKEDVKNNASTWKVETGNENCLLMLDSLSKHFLSWRGDCFEVRRERLESWLMICSVLDPAWIIAYAYQQLIKQNVLCNDELVSILTLQQCPFAFPKGRGDIAFADNHVHLNGHGYSSISMLNFIDGNYKVKQGIRWPYRQEYTLFESGFLDKNDLPRWLSAYSSCLLKNVYNSKDRKGKRRKVNFQSLKDAVEMELTEEDEYYFSEIASLYDPVTLQQGVFYEAAQHKYHAHQRWLLYTCGIMLGAEYEDYANALSNLIRVSNILRNYMVVSAVGLGQFIDFFGFDYRRIAKKSDTENRIHYDSSAGISREYRVSPDFVLGREALPDIYDQQLFEFYSTQAGKGIAEQGHIVVHFTRSFPEKEMPHDKLLTECRKRLRSQCEYFSRFLTSLTLQSVEYKNLLTDEDRKIDVRRLVRGYDVAGNENELQIEVFAPVLRVLRAAKFKGSGLSFKRLQRPFITVHAGEDYSHILSGLRAMDEAVEFCMLGEGDRLGHGLALGVDIKLWARRQKRAYLTVGQHLDNLVWAYHQAVLLSQHIVEHIPVMHELRDKIHYWSHQLYSDTYTPDLLFKAWLLRRNWPDYASIISDPANINEWVPDQHILDSTDDSTAKARKIWQRYLNSGIAEGDAFNRIISVNCAPDAAQSSSMTFNENEDVLSKGELLLYEAIQDFLIEKYSRLGLVIEACPTSNIYIGRLEKYHEHPLFRWNPPEPEWIKPGGKFNRFGLRTGPLSVCINTDDSALMPTTIENEHRLMRDCAIHFYGIGTWMADLWINSIRIKGVEIFNANHLGQDE